MLTDTAAPHSVHGIVAAAGTLAAMVSGSRLPPGSRASELVLAMGGPAEATLIGRRDRVPAVHAALANGMAAHADETDDSHVAGLFHPGCGVAPAALAVAELNETGSERLLRAIALGYDIGARMTMALGVRSARSARFSTHPHGALFGAFAAAADPRAPCGPMIDLCLRDAAFDVAELVHACASVEGRT